MSGTAANARFENFPRRFYIMLDNLEEWQYIEIMRDKKSVTRGRTFASLIVLDGDFGVRSALQTSCGRWA
jgi:hypothetical protein